MRQLPIKPKAKKQLPLQKGVYSEPTVWEPTGRSPSNTPQAIIQAMQPLMPFLMNPQLAQMYGIDAYEVLKVFVSNSPLANAKNILKPKDELQNAQAPQPTGMVAPPQPGTAPVVPPGPGGPIGQSVSPPGAPLPPGAM